MNREINTKNLIDKYGDMINRIAIRYLENIEDAEDIVQEVFIKYIRYLKSGNAFNTEEHEKCWFARVTINLCYTKLKSNKRICNLPYNENICKDCIVNPENILSISINKLENKYKEVFELFYIDEMKVSEISKILDISEANVKTRLKRARDKLKLLVRKGEKVYEKI